MKRHLLALPLLIAVSACGGASDEAFNKSFDESFHSSCLTSATKGGMRADIAVQLCTCGVSEIDAKYSVREKALLSDEQLNEVIETCVKKTVKTNG
ncbi:MAG: hypothetical protein KDE55_03350 [Novosphingobium sp.]|nr:hypothetical protein [Novosphingobium sp.]